MTVWSQILLLHTGGVKPASAQQLAPWQTGASCLREQKKIEERSEAAAEKRNGALADEKTAGSKAGGAAEDEAPREGDR
eukprot:scaffold321467_cov17-Tisochrysis_lutea.AAC.2